LKEKAAERARDFENAFTSSIEVAADPSKQVDVVVIAGDLLDSPHPAPGLAGLVVGRLRDLSQKGILTVLVPGTHDSHLVTGSAYEQIAAIPNVHVITASAVGEPLELLVKGERAFFYGAAYDPQHMGDPFADLRRRDSSGLHIAVLHASLEGSPEWAHRRKDMPLSRETIGASGMDYVALGHYHNFQTGTVNGVAYCYPGTQEGRRFGENGPRYRVTAEVQAGSCVLSKEECNRRTLDVRHVDMSLLSMDSDAELVEYLSGLAAPDLILRVILQGAVSFSPKPAFVQEALAGDFFHAEVMDETAVLGSEWIEQVAREPGVAGVFARRLTAKISNAENSGDIHKKRLLEEALKAGLAAFGR
jgi:DNA repair exonuclease SbcCD nuclease subunit